MEVVIVGNGILGLTAAYKLINRDKDIRISIIGPDNNKGCASLAAAAMFNSFAELDGHTLSNEIDRKKFLFNKSATPYWPDLLQQLEHESGRKIEHGFGTFIINNHVSDDLEDENFDAILNGLREFYEPYEVIAPNSIPKYKPAAAARAGRAIFINREGWVNPISLMAGLKEILFKSGRVKFVNDYCNKLYRKGDLVSSVMLASGILVSGDVYILSPGATFTNIINESNLELDFLKIFYGVGCSLLLRTGPDTLPNCIRTPNRGLACGVYSAPQNQTDTLVGASNLISPEPFENARITSVYTLLKSAMEQINSDYYRSDLVKVNVGWRPTSEDTLPMIGKTSITNLIVATGTKRDGLHCSPVISDYLADIILTGKSEQDMKLYTPEREPVRMYTREEAIQITVRHTINAAYQHDFIPSKGRMVEDLEKYYSDDLNKLHDQVGAYDWGIPPEMINMYRYGHISNRKTVLQ